MIASFIALEIDFVERTISNLEKDDCVDNSSSGKME